jgi:DNA sulfur modification protein DndB
MSEEIEATSSKVNIKEYGDLRRALELATEEAGNTGGQVYPVIMFHQGDRISFSGALSMKRVESFLDLQKAAHKGDSMDKLRGAINRPHIPEHIAAIADYIKENPRDYIIPGLTINVQAEINVYTLETSSKTKAAYMVIPDTAPAAPTDGQHRALGIIKAIRELDPETRARFSQDSVAFMLTCESDIDKAHQDFADCSKTKQLPPAMLTVYDLRNRANGLVIKLVEVCPVFRDKVDSTSKTIGANSSCLFTANQVRQMVKALLTGDFAMADGAFADEAKRLLPTAELYDAELEKIETFVNYLTEHLDVWKEVSQVAAGIQHAKLKQIRNRGYVCLTATGLNIIGRIGHELVLNHAQDWKEYAEKLAKLDWLKTNPLWEDIVQPKKNKEGNVVSEEVEVNGEKKTRPVMQLMTNRAPLNRAIFKVSKAIGLVSQAAAAPPEATSDATDLVEKARLQAERADPKLRDRRKAIQGLMSAFGLSAADAEAMLNKKEQTEELTAQV